MAVARGLLGLPVGALVMAFGAIVLGAPVGIRYLKRTAYWSLLMSVFTFVPPACVFGSSRVDWHRIFAHFKPEESLDALVCLPAYGSVIGAWIGAWPMPLDWERPWQEWPICVTYGAVAGYWIGGLASSVFILIHGPVHVKED
ncbi:phosphatidylinositol-glycan biosynthesis class F protein isoform X3 [Dendrobium catenatum]|nr:phosphatidylinositol-glycan biosynthesis class F protein isoform X3 [Dendrobium catenatum]